MPSWPWGCSNEAGIYTRTHRRLTSTSTAPSGAISAACTRCSTDASTIFWVFGRRAQDGRATKREQSRWQSLCRAFWEPGWFGRVLRAMTGHSFPSAINVAKKPPWTKYKTFTHIGTAEGCLPVQVALANTHLAGAGFDLPMVQPFFEQYVKSFGLQNRLRFQPGDFFKDGLPQSDVLVV